MKLVPGRYVFCERKRISEICKNVDGIRIETLEARLNGYQIYLVEQWAIERNREVATTVSFTGDPAHSILATVIVIDRHDVSCPRLEKVFDKLREANARPKETDSGQLFVTNLSQFSSSLNIVLVPAPGDFDLYQRRFYLNLNLRRMGCSGRSALTSKPPSDAQREKFNQIYRISDSTEFEDTVIRLVDLVQNCLYMFGLFNINDVDGLLCNATEDGIEQFYDTFLKSKFQKFPSDNKLDPSILAGMFSKISNIRGKLQHLVNNVPKDPFSEPVAFVNAVKAFQMKKSDLNVSYLDLKTVDAIISTYQSSFNPQGLKVHKVLKSKIEDFSGMTVVNPDGETTDLEIFAKHIVSESLKQVWRGKPKHKPDMADALASGDWLTGGKELGKSLVRGFGKNSKENKESKESKDSKDVKDGKDAKEEKGHKSKSSKNRQSISKGRSPFSYLKEGGDDSLLVTSTTKNSRSDDERNDGDESEDNNTQFVSGPSTAHGHFSEDETYNNSSNTELTPQPSSVAVFQTVNTLAPLLSQKPEAPGRPEIVCFNLNRPNRPGALRKRSKSMTGLGGEERLLGCRKETEKNMGAIPGMVCKPRKKLVRHPASRKRSQSVSCLSSKDVEPLPLKSLVIECDMLNYNSYQLLKEKEDTLKALFERMQAVEKDLTGQLESLKTILQDREIKFQEIQVEALEIMKERADLLAEVKEKEHSTQISVYNLDGMIGKLVDMRDFTGAFFNKISYLNTKLPVSQRRLAMWMDRLQALQSQWFGTMGRYITAYAPSWFKSRFNAWEMEVQQAASKARDLRGEVEIINGNLLNSAVRTHMSKNCNPTSASQTLMNIGESLSMEGHEASNGLRERRGALKEPKIEIGPYMVTPQSLKSDGDDALKDVSNLLDIRYSGNGDGFMIKDGDVYPFEKHSFYHTQKFVPTTSGDDNTGERQKSNLGEIGSTSKSGSKSE